MASKNEAHCFLTFLFLYTDRRHNSIWFFTFRKMYILTRVLPKGVQVSNVDVFFLASVQNHNGIYMGSRLPYGTSFYYFLTCIYIILSGKLIGLQIQKRLQGHQVKIATRTMKKITSLFLFRCVFFLGEKTIRTLILERLNLGNF